MWHALLAQAQDGLDLSTHLAQASLDVGGAASAVTTAIHRMQRDHETHIRVLSAVLSHMGATFLPIAEGTLPAGDPLERSVKLVLGKLAVGMSAKSTSTARQRSASVGATHSVLDLITRDQLAHADLGFLLWPLVRHSWNEKKKDSSAESFAVDVIENALINVEPVVRTRLARRLKTVGLDLEAAA